METNKRKYSTDSLECTIEESKPLIDNKLSNVEAFLQEAGLNAQLIDKNDKKLVKLNKFVYDPIKQLKPNLIHLSDIDDLPSESDLSSCKTILLPTKSLSNLNKESKKIDSFFCDDKTENILSSSSSDNLNEITKEEISTKKKLKKHFFICNECGKQFFAQNELNKHMLQSHESEKPFECSQCNMSFYDVSSKRRHEKEHLGFKPFRCYICSFEFTRASNLRAHLLKVHPNDIGKTVSITKSIDNKLKFEFNLEEINKKDVVKFPMETNISQTKISPETSIKDKTTNNNKVVYIKDPNNKNAEIQHMIVYVDGKPIFVENPTLQNTSVLNDEKNSKKNSKDNSSNKKPVAKIPYLLAAAAAAAASNHRQHQQQMQKFQQQSLRIISQEPINNSVKNPNKDSKPDQDYLQIVSMLKQKNEKLFNPLI